MKPNPKSRIRYIKIGNEQVNSALVCPDCIEPRKLNLGFMIKGQAYCRKHYDSRKRLGRKAVR